MCWFCPSLPLSLGFRIPAPSPGRQHPPSWLLSNPASLWTAGRPWEWPPALTSPSGLRFGNGGQEQRGTTGLPGWVGGTLPSQHPSPSHNFPFLPSFLHFLHFPLPLLFTLPEYAQAVIMGPESSHITHTVGPSLPAPSQPQSRPRGAPCRPGLMGARWPPGDSAAGLWEPRRPAFPWPRTQLMLPQQTYTEEAGC